MLDHILSALLSQKQFKAEKVRSEINCHRQEIHHNHVTFKSIEFNLHAREVNTGLVLPLLIPRKDLIMTSFPV